MYILYNFKKYRKVCIIKYKLPTVFDLQKSTSEQYIYIYSYIYTYLT